MIWSSVPLWCHLQKISEKLSSWAGGNKNIGKPYGGKMSHFRSFQLLSIGVVIALTFSVPTQAQSVYGTIAGTVTDASGAAIADATVTLTNLGTSEKHSMQSGASGEYTFV